MSVFKSRIEHLRTVEALCYSLCLHLVIEEKIAIHAAKAALLDLYSDDHFLTMDGKERDEYVSKKAISHSIQSMGLRNATNPHSHSAS